MRRGTRVEAVVRGHVAVVDGDGERAARRRRPARGDHHAQLRQAAAGAAVRAAVEAPVARLSDEELAIACASHNGEPATSQVVERLLARAGLGEDA